MIPNIGVKWKLLQFCIRHNAGPDLDPGAAILTEEFLCFPQSLQADAGIVFQIIA
jgi:hypothetical protein